MAIEEIVCTGKHFPEYLYLWKLPEEYKEFGGYYAHCALCGTDYKVKEKEMNRWKENNVPNAVYG